MALKKGTCANCRRPDLTLPSLGLCATCGITSRKYTDPGPERDAAMKELADRLKKGVRLIKHERVKGASAPYPAAPAAGLMTPQIVVNVYVSMGADATLNSVLQSIGLQRVSMP